MTKRLIFLLATFLLFLLLGVAEDVSKIGILSKYTPLLLYFSAVSIFDILIRLHFRIEPVPENSILACSKEDRRVILRAFLFVSIPWLILYALIPMPSNYKEFIVAIPMLLIWLGFVYFFGSDVLKQKMRDKIPFR